MKNKMTDLNDHLFAQLERLGDEDLTPEQIESEAKRAEAVVAIAEQVIRNAEVQWKAVTLLAERGYHFEPHAKKLLGAKDAQG